MAGGRSGAWPIVVAGAAASVALAGCNLIGFAVMTADAATPRTVQAMYSGIEGRSFAVVATTNRMIDADFPGVVPKVMQDVSRRLADEESIGATGFVPPDRVMAYLYAHPNWIARPMSDLTNELGVDRLVFIEITEYRLNEPGNSYIWGGLAAGTVQVYERDSQLPDDPTFDRLIQVQFPDGTNTGENDVAGNVVGSELVRRFVERVSWLFYKHDEAKDLTY